MCEREGFSSLEISPLGTLRRRRFGTRARVHREESRIFTRLTSADQAEDGSVHVNDNDSPLGRDSRRNLLSQLGKMQSRSGRTLAGKRMLHRLGFESKD